MVICTMDFSLASDTRHEKLTNISILVISNVSSFALMYILVTMKVLLAVKVRRVLRVLAQRMYKQTVGSDRSQDPYSAYKDHQENLKNSKSSNGKKSVWENIFYTFTERCKTAGIGSSRSLSQIKEKWRALFEKFKAIVDNSKKTGRGRESFKLFEMIGEFRPKFVKQTQLMENKKNRESENLDKEEAPKDLALTFRFDIYLTLGNRYSRVTAGTTVY